MLFGILGAIAAILLDAAIAYLREDWTNPLGIALVAGVAALSGVIPLLRPERARTPAVPQPNARPSGAQAHGPAQPAPRPGGIPVIVGVLTLLLVCGGGVAAAAFGVQYLGGWLTGDEAGSDILAEETSATNGPLTVTVHSVVVTDHFTRVELSATNGGDIPIILPVYRNCYLDTGVATMQGDPSRSEWAETVPAGQTTRGTVVFDRLPDGVESISISFAIVVGTFDTRSLAVADVPLLTPDRS
jgi:hypothetical protein